MDVGRYCSSNNSWILVRCNSSEDRFTRTSATSSDSHLFRRFDSGNSRWRTRTAALGEDANILTNMATDYDALDGEWERIGLSGPARRTLVDAKLYRVSDLRKITLEQLEELHGMGKSSIARIKVIMNAKKIKFRQD